MEIIGHIIGKLNAQAMKYRKSGFGVANLSHEELVDWQEAGTAINAISHEHLSLEEHIDFDQNPQLISLTEKIRNFAMELSENYMRRFFGIMNEYQESSGRLSPEIKQYLMEHGMVAPSFQVFDPANATTVLQQLHISYEGFAGGLDNLPQSVSPLNRKGYYYFGDEKYNRRDFFSVDRIDNDSLLVILNLPKPLAQFWEKGNAYDVHGTVLEWGHFYNELTSTLLSSRDNAANNNSISLHRVNANRVHLPGSFYYIWKVNLTDQT